MRSGPGTVITERVREKFKRFSETGRVFFMGAAFTKRIAAEIYHYFEEAVYHRLDMPTRRFLLDLSPFERFDTEGGFHFWQIFRNFLIWEDERTRSDAQRRTIMSRGSLFYELHGNTGKALCFYEKAARATRSASF